VVVDAEEKNHIEAFVHAIEPVDRHVEPRFDA
jgi:hypothetical protein